MRPRRFFIIVAFLIIESLGELTCKSDRPPVDHSDAEYDIQIKFS